MAATRDEQPLSERVLGDMFDELLRVPRSRPAGSAPVSDEQFERMMGLFRQLNIAERKQDK